MSPTHRDALPAGTRLHRYQIRSVLGRGAFGITYLADDGDRHEAVAVKEFLPEAMAVREGDGTVRPVSDDAGRTFTWGLERFVAEARTLVKFRHPNIVRVSSVFEANGTAYMVMQYEQGRSLEQALEAGELADEDALRPMLGPLLDGIEHMHLAGVIHHDIKPSSICLRADGTPVLLDFGSARVALADHTRTLTAVVSPGYAPFEQYESDASHAQGPWTDVHALAGVLYHAVAGRPPVDALRRANALLDGRGNPLEPARVVAGAGWSMPFLHAIDAGLAFRAADRPASMAAFRQLLAADGEAEDEDVTVLRGQGGGAAAATDDEYLATIRLSHDRPSASPPAGATDAAGASVPAGDGEYEQVKTLRLGRSAAGRDAGDDVASPPAGRDAGDDEAAVETAAFDTGPAAGQTAAEPPRERHAATAAPADEAAVDTIAFEQVSGAFEQASGVLDTASGAEAAAGAGSASEGAPAGRPAWRLPAIGAGVVALVAVAVFLALRFGAEEAPPEPVVIVSPETLRAPAGEPDAATERADGTGTPVASPPEAASAAPPSEAPARSDAPAQSGVDRAAMEAAEQRWREAMEAARRRREAGTAALEADAAGVPGTAADAPGTARQEAAAAGTADAGPAPEAAEAAAPPTQATAADALDEDLTRLRELQAWWEQDQARRQAEQERQQAAAEAERRAAQERQEAAAAAERRAAQEREQAAAAAERRAAQEREQAAAAAERRAAQEREQAAAAAERQAAQEREQAAAAAERRAAQERQQAAAEAERRAAQERQEAAAAAERRAAQERQEAAAAAERRAAQERQQAEAEARLQAERARQATEESARREAEPAEAAGGESVEASERQLRSLLEAAEEDLAATRLTSPAGRNALEKYQRVLAIDPGNQAALAGKRRIVRRYLTLVEDALGDGQTDRARLFVERAEGVLPEDPAVAEARAALQASAARAMPAEAAVPAAGSAAGVPSVIFLGPLCADCAAPGMDRALDAFITGARSALSAVASRIDVAGAPWSAQPPAAPGDFSRYFEAAGGAEGPRPRALVLAERARATGADAALAAGIDGASGSRRARVVLVDADSGERYEADGPAAEASLLVTRVLARWSAGRLARAPAGPVSGSVPRLAVLGQWCVRCGRDADERARTVGEALREALAGADGIVLHSAPWAGTPAPLGRADDRVRYWNDAITLVTVQPRGDALAALARTGGADAVLVAAAGELGGRHVRVRLFLVDAVDGRVYESAGPVAEVPDLIEALLAEWLAARSR